MNVDTEKEVRKLSEEQKFAACVAAGVPMVHEFNPVTGKFITTTAYPCDVKIIDGRIIVGVWER